MFRISQFQPCFSAAEQVFENFLKVPVNDRKAFRKDSLHLLCQRGDKVFQFPLGSFRVLHLLRQKLIPLGNLCIFLDRRHVYRAQPPNLCFQALQFPLCRL